MTILAFAAVLETLWSLVNSTMRFCRARVISTHSPAPARSNSSNVAWARRSVLGGIGE